MIEINWNPDARTLRWFAGLQIVFFAIFSYLWRDTLGTHGAGALIGVSVVLGTVGLARPGWIRWVYVIWMVVVFPIGWVMSHFILAVVYYLVLTPIAFLVRRRSGDPLRREFDPTASTYWTERRTHEDVSRYFRQY
jgi:hypothetical protein